MYLILSYQIELIFEWSIKLILIAHSSFKIVIEKGLELKKVGTNHLLQMGCIFILHNFTIPSS